MEFYITGNMTDNTSKDVYLYEVRPRKDHRGVNLISDALPFGRLWYDERGVALRSCLQERRGASFFC